MPTKIHLRWWCESCDLEACPESGSRIRQLTSAPALTNNIYCEQPYCSADGNYQALLRRLDPDPYASSDLFVYDMSRLRISRAARGVTGVANAAYSGILFVTLDVEAEKRMIRFDLNTLEREELFSWGDCPSQGLSTVSGDQRFGLGAARLPSGNFAIIRMDLRDGKWTVIHDSPDICNPHLQFRLRTGTRIMIQENRGAVVDKDGNMLQPCNQRGVGLYSIAADGSDRKDFPVGPPVTPSTTGHECWIGDTDRVMVTLSGFYDDGQRRGNVLEASHDWPKPRVVFESPHVWNHVSVSKCGRYFVTDTYQLPDKPIRIGSIQTGKTRVLCAPRTSGGGGQYTHLHPYITSDNRWVVFNSDRTGLAQAFAATIPDGFLDSLE